MIFDLSGKYELTKDGSEKMQGHLPGCTYLDFMAAGMEDPFYGVNEKASHDLGHHDYMYEKRFAVPSDLFGHERIELVPVADHIIRLVIDGNDRVLVDIPEFIMIGRCSFIFFF